MKRTEKLRAGQKYGLLTATELWGRNAKGRIAWRFRCDCGTSYIGEPKSVWSGNTKSCGCLYGRHYKSNSLTWNSWRCMRKRCLERNYHAYPRYGGRGITICSNWDDFESFLRDMGERPSKNHTLDRIDCNGNYEPTNCRWATWRVQGKNKRSTKMLTYKGGTQSVTDWCRELKISRMMVYIRLGKGMSVAQAFETPRDKRRKKGELK